MVAPDNARALSSKILAECMKYHHDVEERQRLKECLEEVKQQADKEDVIIIYGTLSFQNELKIEDRNSGKIPKDRMA